MWRDPELQLAINWRAEAQAAALGRSLRPAFERAICSSRIQKGGARTRPSRAGAGAAAAAPAQPHEGFHLRIAAMVILSFGLFASPEGQGL